MLGRRLWFDPVVGVERVWYRCCTFHMISMCKGNDCSYLESAAVLSVTHEM